jgi:hypothetical protein
VARARAPGVEEALGDEVSHRLGVVPFPPDVNQREAVTSKTIRTAGWQTCEGQACLPVQPCLRMEAGLHVLA